MSLVTMNSILKASVAAYKAGRPFGAGAFNANNMEQMQAIVRAAKETRSPVIIQVSRGALKYSDSATIANIVHTGSILNPEVPIALHLDHGNGLEVIQKALDLGFTSVMMDGSLMPDGKTAATWEYNVDITKKAVELAHRYGVTVEGELGVLGSLGAGAHVTKPDEVTRFAEETGVDALAIAIGTKHGAFKGDKEVKLAFEVLEQIRSEHPELAIVLHGASSVPQEIVADINQFGGNVQKAMGVPIESLQRAIQLGVNKINVDTDVRLVMTAAARKFLAESPTKFDAREWLGPAREAAYQMIMKRMIDFGSNDRAGEVEGEISTNVGPALRNFFAPLIG